MSLFPSDPPAARSAHTFESSWVFAHCDGGSRGNPGPSGFGAVVTDSAGRPLAELSEFLGIRTNNFAEYSGLLAVLEWALTHGHRYVKVVSDSELMVKQIQGKYKVNSPDLKPLWQTARDRIAKLDAFEITHALRHKNKEADALANQAMDRGMKDRGTRDRGMNREPATGGPVESLPLPPRPAAPESRPELRSASHAAPQIPAPAASAAPASTMLRGFTKGGTIHLLGGATLPEGVFVKVIRE